MKNTFFEAHVKVSLSKRGVKEYLLDNAEDLIDFLLTYKQDDINHYLSVTEESLAKFILDGGLMFLNEEEENDGED